MNFAQIHFWLLLFEFLALIVAGRLLLALLCPEWLPLADKVSLLAMGLTLLYCVSWVTFTVFLVVALGSYAGLNWILRYHSRHAFRYVPLLIFLQLAPLCYYKYADFVINGVFGERFDTLRDLIIPVGISFYTFQKIAFVIDTLVTHEPLPRFLDYLNFAGFFPQIVAGPIERRHELLPQMESFRWRWLAKDIDEGARWIFLGLFFKLCLADNLAVYVDLTSTTNPYSIWLSNLLFGLRIYYDFAGYSLIALGLARALGLRLTLNFASPYASTSYAEFWRRWHITLSQWFRDYLYIPLGGSRTSFWAANVMVVFMVSGIWHGAGWNFLLWGFLHGLFLVLNRLMPKVAWPNFLKWLVTMLGVFFAWLCFYELRPHELLAKIATLLSPHTYLGPAFTASLQVWHSASGVVMFCFLVLSGVTLTLEWLSVRRRGEAYFYLRRPAVLVVLVILTVLLAPGENNGFIYFAF